MPIPDSEGRPHGECLGTVASDVTLLLYAEGATPLARLALRPLVNKTGRVWHCRVREEQVGPARYYAYAIDGPNDGSPGQRFDREGPLRSEHRRAPLSAVLRSRRRAL
jgi:glycogen operon protein